MSAYQTIALFLRLGAIWLALRSVLFIALALAESGGELRRASPVASALAIVALLVALCLWTFPLTIARKLLPRTDDDQPLPTGDGQLTRVVLAAAGIAIIVFVGPEFAWSACYWFIAQVNSQAGDDFSTLFLRRLFVGGLQLGAGVFLVARTRTVMRWLSRST